MTDASRASVTTDGLRVHATTGTLTAETIETWIAVTTDRGAMTATATSTVTEEDAVTATSTTPVAPRPELTAIRDISAARAVLWTEAVRSTWVLLAAAHHTAVPSVEHAAVVLAAAVPSVVLAAAVPLAEALVEVPSVEAHVEVPSAVVPTAVEDLTDTVDAAKSQFQHPHLCIHHALHFVHWFSIIYCLNGLVDDTVANSQHLLSWECLLDIGDEFASPGKQVF